MCCCQKVCFVSQHSVKSVQEMPGDRPVLPVEVVCTVGGQKFTSSTAVCSFVQRGKKGTPPKPCKNDLQQASCMHVSAKPL